MPKRFERKGLQYDPPKLPSRMISSGDLLGRKSGCDSKRIVPLSSRTGFSPSGSHNVHPAIIASTSLEGSLVDSVSESDAARACWGFEAFFTRGAPLRDEATLTSSSLSSS